MCTFRLQIEISYYDKKFGIISLLQICKFALRVRKLFSISWLFVSAYKDNEVV